MLGERAYSAQETVHILLGIPLVHARFSYQTVNLTTDGSLRHLADNIASLSADEDLLTGESWLKRYMS